MKSPKLQVASTKSKKRGRTICGVEWFLIRTESSGGWAAPWNVWPETWKVCERQGTSPSTSPQRNWLPQPYARARRPELFEVRYPGYQKPHQMKIRRDFSFSVSAPCPHFIRSRASNIPRRPIKTFVSQEQSDARNTLPSAISLYAFGTDGPKHLGQQQHLHNTHPIVSLDFVGKKSDWIGSQPDKEEFSQINIQF